MNRRRCAIAAAAVGVLLLAAGCTTLAPTARPAGLINGRLSLQIAATPHQPARQLSSSFELRGDAERGQLDLNSPLGLTLAQARWAPGRVEMVSGGADPVVYANLDQLAQQAFGEALPLAALFDWLRGRPWVGAASTPLARGGGFTQLGWEVDTARQAEGQIVARRAAAPAVTLRVVLEPKELPS